MLDTIHVCILYVCVYIYMGLYLNNGGIKVVHGHGPPQLMCGKNAPMVTIWRNADSIVVLTSTL